jgi:hypothetical protein
MLNAGHNGLYGSQSSGLSMAWQRAVAEEGREPAESTWSLTAMTSMLILVAVFVVSREPLVLELPSAW